MAVNLIKIASIGGGLATGGVIGGGAYYLINQNKKASLATNESPKKESKAISEWLSKDAKVLLQTSDSEWSERWSSFKQAYPKGKAPTGVWAFNNWDTAFDGNGDGLKTKCLAQGQQKIEGNSGELYEAVKKYCTKDKPAGSH